MIDSSYRSDNIKQDRNKFSNLTLSANRKFLKINKRLLT